MTVARDAVLKCRPLRSKLRAIGQLCELPLQWRRFLLDTPGAIPDRGETFRCRLRLMAPAPASVLAINGGSSSVKFAVHQAGTPLKPSLYGKLDRIGLGGSTLSWHATESR